MRTKAAAVLVAVAAAAAGACAPARAASDERVIRIAIHQSRFEPSALRVAPGSLVRFVITNHDPINHEFIVGDEEVHRAHATGAHGSHGEVPGEVTVPAGMTGETTLRFPDEPGTVMFACHLPRHLDYGMQGVVTVAGR